MRTTLSSGRTAGACSPGDRFLWCRRWEDPAVDFEDVVVGGRRGPRVSIEILSGPEKGESANVFASSLWTRDQLSDAKEGRARDHRIAEVDREHPVDDATKLAIEILCSLATGDTDVESRATLETVLVQLGRPTELDELHETAYADDGFSASVSAPAVAWKKLFEEFARSRPDMVEERAAAEVANWRWVSDPARASAVARVRLWAGLLPVVPALQMREAPPGRDSGKRIQKAISAAASQLLTSSAETAPLEESFRIYRRSQEELGQEDPAFSGRVDVWRQTRQFAEGLVDLSEKPMDPLMRWLLGELELRGEFCEHIVWSDYTAHHPRALHLFPDGHLFPVEEGVSRRIPGTLTACGRQIVLRWGAGRSWERAWHGQWLQHYEALTRYREEADREKAQGETPRNRVLEPDYEMARRICVDCANFHGLFLECLEGEDDLERWPPWRLAEIARLAQSTIDDRLKAEPPMESLEGALQIALEVRLQSEIEMIAREVKRLGPGPLRRLFGERGPGSSSLYERWSVSCEPVGLEPHELLSRAMWERVLTESLDLFGRRNVPTKDRRTLRDRIRKAVEARIAGLA